MILPTLSGPHVPRFVAAGDIRATPYIVMEWIEGRASLATSSRARRCRRTTSRASARRSPMPCTACTPGSHPSRPQARKLHAAADRRGGAARLRLRPARALSRSAGRRDSNSRRARPLTYRPSSCRTIAAIRAAISSRSACSSTSSRPARSRSVNPRRSPGCATGCGASRRRRGRSTWTCRPGCRRSSSAASSTDAAARYQSAAHIAFDLRHPEQVALIGARRRTAPGLRRATASDGGARGARPIAAGRGQRAGSARVSGDPGRGRYRASRRRAPSRAAMDDCGRSSRSIPSSRLMCVSVIRGAPVGEGARLDTATGRHLEHKVRLRHWVEPLRSPVVAGFAARRRRRKCRRHAARPRARQSRRSHRARRAGTVAASAGMVALGGVDASPRTRTAASTSCAFRRADWKSSPTRAKEPLNKSHTVATGSFGMGCAKRRRSEWSTPFARLATKQTARKAPSLRAFAN